MLALISIIMLPPLVSWTGLFSKMVGEVPVLCTTLFLFLRDFVEVDIKYARVSGPFVSRLCCWLMSK